MSVKVGDVVISKKGHDKKKAFIVVAVLNENYVLIADGKTRKLDSLKQKNVRHLETVAQAGFSERELVDDKSIANKLKQSQTE